MFDEILLPVDGSEASQLAIEYTLLFADTFDATVHTLYVLDSGDVPDGFDDSSAEEPFESELREIAQSVLDAVRQTCDNADVDVTESVTVGHPTEEILDYVTEHGISFVVLGAHARGRLARFLRRSIAQQVARQSSVPVLTVPERDTDDDVEIQRVLLANDESEGARKARNYAFELATAYDAIVYALYVIETRFGSSGQLWNLLEQQAKTLSREVRVQGAQAGIDVTTVTREGVPEQEILDLAEENDIDLIVLGTHGREGIDRFVMGSVAASVLRNARRPVLTVRSNSSD